MNALFLAFAIGLSTISTVTSVDNDLASLGGASPSVVASFFGSTAVAPSSATEAQPCSEGIYTFSGGSATVQYCHERAYAFYLTFGQAEATAEALLARTGLTLTSSALSGLSLVEESEGHRLWMQNPDASVPEGVMPCERLLLAKGLSGWSQISLDFPSAQ